MSTHKRRGNPVNGRRIPALLRILSTASLIVVLAGCGGDEPPSAAAPELGETLSEVDDALERGNYARAERALEELVDEAEQAEQAGTISAADADRIREAASKLLARLPDDGVVDEPDDAATSPAPVDPSPSEEPEGDEKEDKDEEKDEEEKDEEEKDKGGGNGQSEDNGPDDGHGN
jgi:hypothetical protein